MYYPQGTPYIPMGYPTDTPVHQPVIENTNYSTPSTVYPDYVNTQSAHTGTQPDYTNTTSQYVVPHSSYTPPFPMNYNSGQKVYDNYQYQSNETNSYTAEQPRFNNRQTGSKVSELNYGSGAEQIKLQNNLYSQPPLPPPDSTAPPLSAPPIAASHTALNPASLSSSHPLITSLPPFSYPFPSLLPNIHHTVVPVPPPGLGDYNNPSSFPLRDSSCTSPQPKICHYRKRPRSRSKSPNPDEFDSPNHANSSISQLLSYPDYHPNAQFKEKGLQYGKGVKYGVKRSDELTIEYNMVKSTLGNLKTVETGIRSRSEFQLEKRDKSSSQLTSYSDPFANTQSKEEMHVHRNNIIYHRRPTDDNAKTKPNRSRKKYQVLVTEYAHEQYDVRHFEDKFANSQPKERKHIHDTRSSDDDMIVNMLPDERLTLNSETTLEFHPEITSNSENWNVSINDQTQERICYENDVECHPQLTDDTVGMNVLSNDNKLNMKRTKYKFVKSIHGYQIVEDNKMILDSNPPTVPNFKNWDLSNRQSDMYTCENTEAEVVSPIYDLNGIGFTETGSQIQSNDNFNKPIEKRKKYKIVGSIHGYHVVEDKVPTLESNSDIAPNSKNINVPGQKRVTYLGNGINSFSSNSDVFEVGANHDSVGVRFIEPSSNTRSTRSPSLNTKSDNNIPLSSKFKIVRTSHGYQVVPVNCEINRNEFNAFSASDENFEASFENCDLADSNLNDLSHNNQSSEANTSSNFQRRSSDYLDTSVDKSANSGFGHRGVPHFTKGDSTGNRGSGSGRFSKPLSTFKTSKVSYFLIYLMLHNDWYFYRIYTGWM